MTTLWNISFHRENNQKFSPLSLIPYTPYTNLRPSCLHKQTIITFCTYVASFLSPCDISMLVDRKRSYLLASEPRAAREKSKIIQIKASAHACSQSIGNSHSPVSVNLYNGEYELFSHIFNNNTCIKQTLLLSGYQHKLGSVTAFPFKPSYKRIKINIRCPCKFPKWQPVLGSEAGSERVGKMRKSGRYPKKGGGAGKRKKKTHPFPSFLPRHVLKEALSKMKW